MESTAEKWLAAGQARMAELESQEGELAEPSAHLNAATARWLQLALAYRDQGSVWDDYGCWLAARCGITVREARECLRVGEALEQLPVLRAAFQRGELTLTKLRALTRVATARTEKGLLELASVLTASQLERALRVYRRLSSEQARETHELEYVDYYWDEDGSLVLRARLAAEDGTLLVKALDAARERIWEQRRATRQSDGSPDPVSSFEPPRPLQVKALVEMAQTALANTDGERQGRARLVVHIDAAALTTNGPGPCELEDGPVIAPETARRLGCDSDQLTVIERDGLPVSVGRTRRTVPPTLRRLLETRDQNSCRWPGCDRHHHLAAHHRRHWAHGGHTSLDNLLLLCPQHHRLIHEGGYTIQQDTGGQLRFRNRHGLLHPTPPSRPPPGRTDTLIQQNQQAALQIDPHTNKSGDREPMNLECAIDALQSILN